MPDTHGTPPLPPVTVAEITDEIWLEVARRHAEDGRSRELVQQPRPAATPAPLRLEELLALDGTDFIEAAYGSVLGRRADEAGLAHLSAELARGREKTELLGNLQNSPEGQQAGRFIEGLRQHEAGRRLSRVPVVGRAMRVGLAVLRRAAPSGRAGRASPAAAARAEAQAQMAAFEAGLESWRRAMEGQLIDHRLAVDTVTRRLATVQAAHEELGRKTLKVMAEQAALLATLTERSTGFARQLAATEDAVIESLLALADTIAGHGARLQAMEGGAGARVEATCAALRAELHARVAAAKAIAAQNAHDVAEQQRRTEAMSAATPGDASREPTG